MNNNEKDLIKENQEFVELLDHDGNTYKISLEVLKKTCTCLEF
jgi:hypothetical protein